MSDLVQLVDRGMEWIGRKTPKMISIDGGPLIFATVDFIGLQDSFGDETRHREVNYDATVVIRRVHLATAPALGALVTIDTRIFRVFKVTEDEAAITLLVDSPNR